MRMILLLIALLIPSFSIAGPLETKINQYDELEHLLQKYCLNNPNSKEVKVPLNGTILTCNHLLVLANRLKSDIDEDVNDLESSCDQNQGGEATNLARDASRIASQSVCKPVSTDLQCLGSFTCSLASQVGKSIPLFGKKISGMVRSCKGNYSAGGCLMSIAKGIFDSLWGLVSAIWDVGKAAVRGVGEWLGVIEAGENSTSEKLMAAQRAGRAYVKRFINHPIDTMKQTASAIFNGVKQAAMESYGCEQWSDPRRPFVSRCARPMTNWNCATCQQKFQVLCGAAGLAIGEIPAALLTGGVAGALKGIARATSAAIRANARIGRVSKGVVEILSKFRPPAGLTRATEAIAARTGRVLSAVERRVIGRWNQLKDNPLSRLLARKTREAATTEGKEAARFRLRPIGAYLDAIEAAAKLGFKTGDNVVGGALGAGTRDVASAARIAETAGKADDLPAGSMAQIERTLPPEARAVDEVTPQELNNLAGDTVNVPEDLVDLPEARVPAPEVSSSPSSSAITVSDTRVAVPEISPPNIVSPSSPGIIVDSPVSPVRAPANVVRAAEQPEDIIQRLAGNRYDLEDREITIDILSGKGKREEYFEGANRSPEFRSRYEKIEKDFEAMDPAERQRLTDEFRKGADEVVAGGNERAARELDDLSKETKLKTEDIDCNAMNALYPGSFPARGGKCKRVEFEEESKGNFCACGAMTKDNFNFLTRCPRSSQEFHSVFGFANGVALPSTSLPQSCTRVNIPKGKECYFGSTSATYAGLGGLTQLLCLDEASPRLRRSSNGAIEQFKIQIGTPRVQPVRWSPFSDFEDLQVIIERASRVCKDKCETSIFRNLNRDYAAALERIEARTTDPVKLARLQSEKESFGLYMQGLRDGRLPTPNLSRAASLSDADRLTEARRIIRKELTPDQQAAVIRAHNVGNDHGYFTYTQSEISEKARILREAGLDRTQVRGLMKNGVVGGLPESALDPVDAFIRARSDARVASENAGKIRDGGITITEVKDEYRAAAQGYAAEAARTESPQLTAEAWKLFTRSGDTDEAFRLVNDGVRRGMNPRSILAGMDRDLVDLNRRIAQKSTPALVVERDSLKALREKTFQKLNASAGPVRAVASTERDLTGRITDSLHENWRENFIKTNGADAIRMKPVPESVLRAGETPGTALSRLESQGVKGLSVEDGKLVQNINQPAAEILPELNQKLNGNLASEYAILVERGTYRSTSDFDRASSEIHNIWMRNNEWQREASPGLFKPYNELSAEEKIKDLDVLAESLRARDPQLLNSAGYKEYRQKLERDVRREAELNRPASSYRPAEAQRIANDFRLGLNGRPKDPAKAAEFYYRATDDLIEKEARRTRGYANGGSNFMGDNNFSEAIEQSLNSDGAVAIRMMEQIRASGGETRQMSAVNSFLAENFDRWNTPIKNNPVMRRNLQKLFQHVEENYGSALYTPQRNYLNSWKRAQYVED
jgi:hypothetical protein